MNRSGLIHFALIPVTVAAVGLAGCNTGGAGSGGNPFSGGGGGGAGGSGDITLNSFTATGTNGATTSPASGNPVTIDGNQNGGQFQIGWTSSGGAYGYGAALFLATKPGDTGSDAQQILSQNCGLGGEGGSPDCPANTGAMPCTFNEANMTMLCPNNEGGQPVNGATQFPIGQWLSDHGGLPGSYSLVLQLCSYVNYVSGGGDQCQTKTIPVNLN